VKGLEFDVVIVLNPGEILNELLYENSKAARLMYVLATRPTQHLHIIGRNSMESKRPIDFYNKLDLQEEDVQLSISDLEIEISESTTTDLSNPGSISIGETSIVKLCRDFNLQINTTDEQFLANGWFYLGLSQNMRCVSCNFKQQQVFRTHLEVDGIVSHPGAFVCLGCMVARKSSVYSRDNLALVDLELLNGSKVDLFCETCQQ
jgi:hypothetical protein